MLKKIISGGQTGADRGGLDAARELGLERGGFVPRERRSEDGQVPDSYKNMVQTESRSFGPRTLLNVKHSDGTILFTRTYLGPGSKLTISFAEKEKKPLLHIDLAQCPLEITPLICRWIQEHQIQILNVAGSRESSAVGIQEEVTRKLVSAITILNALEE